MLPRTAAQRSCKRRKQADDQTTMMLLVILIYVANSIVTGNAQDYAVRLNNAFGNNSKEGRLEIYYTGGWGTVCDDDFTNACARVACNSLGFGYMGAVIGNSYGAGVDPIWLDDVNCTGSETGIEECEHNAWGVNDCSHSEDVSISCDCTSRNFSQRTGKISSPNFPSEYANDLNCDNYIAVQTGQKVRITFLAFDTETCCDSVTITCESGINYTSPRYSGSQIPAVLTLSSCTLVNVAFQTDGTVLSTGFSLTYNITSDCADRYFNGSSGQISSPNFPMQYSNYLDCSSYITVPSVQTVIITFLVFVTEPAFDWVTITCVSGNNYTSPMYSGSHIPPILTISSCSLVAVHFHTDRSTTNTGFTLAYNTTVTDCVDRYFSEPTGQIFSPNFPMAYSNNQDCSSLITVLTGQKITITFLAFNTESVNDWATISCTSGVTYTTPRYSGSQIPAVLTIYSCNQVKVHFHTDGSTTNTGFNLTYNITSDCGDQYFSESTGQISSPNFPMAYSDNQDCFSYITVQDGQKITFTFLIFNTESVNDWVTITCTSGNAFTSPQYSGSQVPPVVTIISCNQVNVHFHTDGSTVYTGFNLTYDIALVLHVEDETNRPNTLAIILGALLGAAVLIIIIILAILLCRKICHQQKPNEASDFGHLNHGNEHELREKGRESNSYETGVRHNVDLDESENANAGGLQRPASMFPDDYEELNIAK